MTRGLASHTNNYMSNTLPYAITYANLGIVITEFRNERVIIA